MEDIMKSPIITQEKIHAGEHVKLGEALGTDDVIIL
jgi:hypothetical protein